MDALQQILGVLVVLGCLAASLWWLRRKGFAQFALPSRSQSDRRMRVVERLALTTQHSVHLISVDGRSILVGVSPAGCQLLQQGQSE